MKKIKIISTLRSKKTKEIYRFIGWQPSMHPNEFYLKYAVLKNVETSENRYVDIKQLENFYEYLDGVKFEDINWNDPKFARNPDLYVII